MVNKLRSGPGDPKPFSGEGRLIGDVATIPFDSGAAAGAAASVFHNISGAIADLADQAAASEGKLAGLAAGQNAGVPFEGTTPVPAGTLPAAPTAGTTGAGVPVANINNDLVDRVIGQESGGDPNAKSPKSSATGVGQFIDSTWLALIAKYKPGLMRPGMTEADVLALRTDPALSREMAGAYLNEGATALRNDGISTTPGNIYLSYHLGPGGAAALLKAPATTSTWQILSPEVLKANPHLVGKSAWEVKAWAEAKMAGPPGAALAATTQPTATGGPPGPGPLAAKLTAEGRGVGTGKQAPGATEYLHGTGPDATAEAAPSGAPVPRPKPGTTAAAAPAPGAPMLLRQGGVTPLEAGGANLGLLSQPTQGLLAGIRAANVVPVLRVTSGFRSETENIAKGGATHSQHLEGNALDINIAGLPEAQKAALLQAAIASGARGIGIYGDGNSTLHVDTRPTPTLWGKHGYGGNPLTEAPAWAQPALRALFTGAPAYGPPAPGAGPAGGAPYVSAGQAGPPLSLASDNTIRGRAFNQAATAAHGNRVEISLANDLGAAWTANKDDPVALEAAFHRIRQTYLSAGEASDPRLREQFDQAYNAKTVALRLQAQERADNAATQAHAWRTETSLINDLGEAWTAHKDDPPALEREFQRIKQEYLANGTLGDPQLKELFEKNFETRTTTYRTAARELTANRQKAAASAAGATLIESQKSDIQRQAYLIKPGDGAAGAIGNLVGMGERRIDAMVAAGTLDPGEAEKQKRALGETAVHSMLRGQFDSLDGPEQKAAFANDLMHRWSSGDPALGQLDFGSVSAIVNELQGDARQAAAVKTPEMLHAQATMAGLVEDDIASTAETGKGVLSNGNPLNAAEVAKILGPAAAEKWFNDKIVAGQIHAATEGMELMTPAAIAARANEWEPKATDAGFATKEKIHAAVVKNAGEIARKREQDPALAVVTAFPTLKSSGEDLAKGGPAALVPVINARINAETAVGIRAADQKGLTKGEAKMVGDWMEASPDGAVAVARALSGAGLSPEKVDSVLRQIGDAAPALATIADQVAKGNSDQTLRLIATQRNVEAAEGYKAPPASPVQETAIRAVTYGGAFAGLPFHEARLTEAAGLIFRRLAVERGINPADMSSSDSKAKALYDEALQLAAGGELRGGKWFGGVTTVNGAQTLAPVGVAQDSVEPTLRGMTSDEFARLGPLPVSGTGIPVRVNDIAGGRLVAVKDGIYRVATGDAANPQFALLPNGQFWTLDIRQLAAMALTRPPTPSMLEGGGMTFEEQMQGGAGFTPPPPVQGPPPILQGPGVTFEEQQQGGGYYGPQPALPPPPPPAPLPKGKMPEDTMRRRGPPLPLPPGGRTGGRF